VNDFFLEKYKSDLSLRKAPSSPVIPLKNKKQIPVTRASVSPNGRYMTYVTNHKGKIKLYLQEVSGENRTIIYRQGVKNVFQATDYQYPLVSWSPTGKEIMILTEKKDKLFLGSYNQFIIHSEPGTIPLSNILEPLDNISPESEHVQAPPKVDPAYRY